MHELVREARKFSTEVHRRIDHRRKYSKKPYEVHLKAVAQIVSSVCDDPEMIAAAWLHDTVEDTPATIDEIEGVFGKNVALLISELTDVSRASDGNRSVRKAIDRAHLAHVSARAQTIKLADLIDNCQDICHEDPTFAIVFCNEMEALLAVLKKGDQGLHKRAEKTLQRCRSCLGQESFVGNPPEELSPYERYSISEHQRALRTFARTFTPADIAEPLRSFDGVRPASEVRKVMLSKGLLVVGVRNNGKVSGYVSLNNLREGLCGDVAIKIHRTQVLTIGSSLTEVVNVLNRHDYCFITVLGEVVGVIGRGDMHKPVIRMWLFGVISFIEIQYTDQIRLIYPNNAWSHLLSQKRLNTAKALQNERLRRSQPCELIDCLQFGDKLRILSSDKKQLERFGFKSAGAAKRVIKELESLRNNLAHGQDFISYDWPQVIRIANRMEVMMLETSKIQHTW